ncbi:hypothetical protein RCCGEPOP_06346 [Rhizobium sp. Pop5]|nr:hypothetical protein RCCGEPOP_06346 [Rhizobium sp. Pop5]
MYSFEVEQKVGSKTEKILINPMHVIFVKALANGATAIGLTGGTQINSSTSYTAVAESLNAAMR